MWTENRRITEHQGSGCVGEEADYKRTKARKRGRGCLHAGTDLKTTQIYLGKVSGHEAIRWMDILHGK